MIGRPRHTWERNVKMSVDWIHLAQGWGSLGGLWEHSKDSFGSIKCWECYEFVSNY
jgi:hypothetical protein